MTEFDPTQGYVTNADGETFQVLDADGRYDDAATGLEMWRAELQGAKGAAKAEAQEQVAILEPIVAQQEADAAAAAEAEDERRAALEAQLAEAAAAHEAALEEQAAQKAADAPDNDTE